MNGTSKIPPGLSPEQERVFKTLAESKAYLTQQLQQIRAVVKQDVGKQVTKTRVKFCERTGSNGKIPKPLSAIREFCIQCVGGSKNNRKPWKAVRECVVSDCPLHSFRMGKNPYHKRIPAETQ